MVVGVESAGLRSTKGGLRAGQPGRSSWWSWMRPAFASLRSAKAGGLAGTRTPDQCLKRALLYQLSYQPNRAQKNRVKPPKRKIFSPSFQGRSRLARGGAKF